MSQNIFGYQGINTPLASLTRGRYNVADYTQLREQLNARITALEKKESNQENEIIKGYVQIIASPTQTGYLSVASTGTFGGNVQTAGILSSLGGLSVGQNASITGNLVTTGTTTCTGALTANNGVTINGSALNANTQANFSQLVAVSANGIRFSDNSIQTTAALSSAAVLVNDLYYDQTLNQIITPLAASNKQTEIVLNYNNSCTVNLLYLTAEDSTAFPDGIRYVSITKGAMATTDYTVTIEAPGNGSALVYPFYTPSGQNSSTYSLNTGKYGVTFMITKYGNANNRRTYVKSLVN